MKKEKTTKQVRTTDILIGKRKKTSIEISCCSHCVLHSIAFCIESCNRKKVCVTFALFIFGIDNIDIYKCTIELRKINILFISYLNDGIKLCNTMNNKILFCYSICYVRLPKRFSSNIFFYSEFAYHVT